MSPSDSLDLSGKVALITGSTRGIGFAIAEKLAAHGATVLVNGRDPEQTTLAKTRLIDKGYSCDELVLDISNSAQVQDAFKGIFKQYKRLDILVNNAGIMQDALIGMTTESQVTATYEVNVFGMIYCSQYASRLMQRTGGAIINISSIIGTNGNSGQAVYGSSKAAVIGLTRSLSKELADKNIRVNSIAPGFIDTDMTRVLSEEVIQERITSIKMNRAGTPEDIANVALFLSSELSSYITGQVIGVDGGMLI